MNFCKWADLISIPESRQMCIIKAVPQDLFLIFVIPKRWYWDSRFLRERTHKWVNQFFTKYGIMYVLSSYGKKISRPNNPSESGSRITSDNDSCWTCKPPDLTFIYLICTYFKLMFYPLDSRKYELLKN
jgi:hypothetical protein